MPNCISELPQRGIRRINKLISINHFSVKGSMEARRITSFIIQYYYHSMLTSPALSCVAPALSVRRVKQPCSLAVPTSTIPAPGRWWSLALPGIPGHSGAQRHRKAHRDGSKPTGFGQPALQRSPSTPLGVQVPLKSGPQHRKSGAEWGGEPRDEVSRLLPFHVQFPAGPGATCSECIQGNISHSSRSPLTAALQYPQLNLPVHSCPGT